MLNWIKNFIKTCNQIEKEVRDAGYIYHCAPGYPDVIVQKVQKPKNHKVNTKHDRFKAVQTKDTRTKRQR
mgnify:FL=1